MRGTIRPFIPLVSLLVTVLILGAVIFVRTYIRQNYLPPEVVDITEGVNAAGFPSFTITFSKPMPKALRFSAISVKPDIEIRGQYSEDRMHYEVEVLEQTAPDTVYQFAVGPVTSDIPSIDDRIVGEQSPLVWTYRRDPVDITIAAGGDVLFDHLPRENLENYGPEYIFAEVRDYLSGADLAMVNLENPVVENGEKIEGKLYTFAGHPLGIDALVSAGIDIVSFANNHAFDCGNDGFLETLSRLKAAGIAYAGAGRNSEEAASPVVFDIKGKKIGVVAFGNREVLPKTEWHQDLWGSGPNDPGIIFYEDRAKVLEIIEGAAKEVDYLVVSMHWCYEYTEAPYPHHHRLARDMIEAGADVVLGHHPHVPFGIEYYNDRPIVYSLGNFVWHPWDPDAFESFMVMVTFPEQAEAGIGLQVIPIRSAGGRAELLVGERADRVLGVITERSKAFGLEFLREGDTLTVVKHE